MQGDGSPLPTVCLLSDLEQAAPSLWSSAQASLGEPDMMGLHLPGAASLTDELYRS